MSQRRSFIKNSLMALAVAFLPKLLQPSIPEITEDEVVEVRVEWKVYVLLDGEFVDTGERHDDKSHTISMKRYQYEAIKNKVL